MSKRLQVVMDEEELRELGVAARRDGTTVSEWVRRELREARRRRSSGDVERKLRAIEKAMQYEFPAPAIEQMNAEIERGYLQGMAENDPPG